jgi:hypothetical protein
LIAIDQSVATLIWGLIVKFTEYVVLQLKFAFSSSLAVGLVLGLLILAIGGVEGDITMNIDLSRSDSVWLLLGVPAAVTLLFLIVAPVAYFLFALLFSARTKKSSQDA